MQIKLLSDLHFEFSNHKYNHIFENLDKDSTSKTVLVLAGDIDVGNGAEDFVNYATEYYHSVIMVPGNHEFYNRDFDYVIDWWRNFELNDANKNFHFLYNDWRIIDNVRFLGGTMWTGFKNADPTLMDFAHRALNDYECIGYQDSKITANFILQQHQEFIKFLNKKLEEPFEGATAVITHHSPGSGLKRKGREYKIDHLYFADVEKMIGDIDKIKLWMHGHTHQNWDYMINNTRVVCNPYGYYNQAINNNFDQNLIIEI